VVDGSAVLISSQNWSTDGTLYNRDAGVIIENDAAAAYFQRIFDHDWDHLARQTAQPD
jgi:phosphatidylserine/phosphatidylglycerophosphate/cardiolipin synthase-like enzyme